MMLDQLDARLETLRKEAAQAEEEVAKIRPRLQYLQEMLLRLEGAIVALTQLREEQGKLAPRAPTVIIDDSMAQPVAP